MVTHADKIVDLSTLASELRYFEGVLAVATSHALLYLIDLALDLGGKRFSIIYFFIFLVFISY